MISTLRSMSKGSLENDTDKGTGTPGAGSAQTGTVGPSTYPTETMQFSSTPNMVFSVNKEDLNEPQLRVYKHVFVNSNNTSDATKLEVDAGFDWRKSIAPLLPGCPQWCMKVHTGILLSGEMGVQMQNGSISVIKEGEVYCVPAGHIPVARTKAVMVEFNYYPPEGSTKGDGANKNNEEDKASTEAGSNPEEEASPTSTNRRPSLFSNEEAAVLGNFRE